MGHHDGDPGPSGILSPGSWPRGGKRGWSELGAGPPAGQGRTNGLRTVEVSIINEHSGALMKLYLELCS